MRESDHQSIRYPVAFVIGTVFVIGIITPILLRTQPWYEEWLFKLPYDLRVLVHPAIRMCFALIGWLCVRSMLNEGEHLKMGLKMPPKRAILGIVVGCVCTLPMLVLGLFSEMKSFSYTLIYSTVLPGVTEEIFFRAFAFGLFIQAARMKLWPAAITTGIIFALAHLVRSDVRAMPIGEMLGWLAMLAAGGLFFAWIYAKAPWHLWVVISLHASMNLWWDMFDLNTSPLGVAGSTAIRIISVGLVVYLVVFRGVLRPKSPSTIPA